MNRNHIVTWLLVTLLPGSVTHAATTTNFRITNNSGAPARSDLHLEFSGTGGSSTLALRVNASGCGSPTVTNPGTPWTITWPLACVDPGEAIVVAITSQFPPPQFASGYWTPGNVPLAAGDVVVQTSPPYEPQVWNDGTGDPPNPNNRQVDNNCYNYATNQQTNTYAQPGRQGGSPIGSADCASVMAATKLDGLVNTTRNAPCADGYKVALVTGLVQTNHGVRQDFHWYRQDANGKWSHKPGETEATNKDSRGNEITDPETADKGTTDDGRPQYANFCGYFCVTTATQVRLASAALPPGTIRTQSNLIAAPPLAGSRVSGAGAHIMSNQIIAKPLALSGMEDPTVVFSSSADLDSLTGMLSGLTPTSDPGWESQLGYRGFFLEVDNVAPVGSELVRVWNGVVRIDQGSTRSFYVDSKGLEAWLLRRVVEVPGWTPIGLAALATLMIGTGLWWVTRRKLGGHIPA